MIFTPAWRSGLNTTLDYADMVAIGRVDGVAPFRKFGYCLSRSTSPLPIWPLNTDYTFPTTAATLSIASADTNDTAAGTGARSVTVFGLDADFLDVTETIALSGTTPVVTTNSFIRVNRVIVSTVGTYGGSNAGVITLTHGGTAATIAMIPATGTYTQQLIYTVPANKTFVVTQVNVSVASTKGADILYFVRGSADVVTAPFAPLGRFGNSFGVNATSFTPLVARAVLAGKTDIIVYANSTTGTVDVSGGFQGNLYTTS